MTVSTLKERINAKLIKFLIFRALLWSLTTSSLRSMYKHT